MNTITKIIKIVILLILLFIGGLGLLNSGFEFGSAFLFMGFAFYHLFIKNTSKQKNNKTGKVSTQVSSQVNTHYRNLDKSYDAHIDTSPKEAAYAKFCKKCRGTLEFTRNMNRKACPRCNTEFELVKLCNICHSSRPHALNEKTCRDCGHYWLTSGWEKCPLE